jgi:hypothetical protein
MTEFLFEYRAYIAALHVLATVLGLGGAIVTDLMFMRFLKDYRIHLGRNRAAPHNRFGAVLAVQGYPA